MKTAVSLLAILFSFASYTQEAIRPGDEINIKKDVRIVSGVKIDLTPVHAWFRNRNGERPLKHWKQLQVFKIEQAGPSDLCTVKTEDGGFTKMVILNLPANVKTYFGEISRKQAAIAQLKTQIDHDEPIVNREDAVAPTGASGDASYPGYVNSQRVQANLDMVALNEKKQALAKLESELDVLKNRTDLVTVFAMFSGRKYGDDPIWDCGVLVSQ
jgi:hypothetical protein